MTAYGVFAPKSETVSTGPVGCALMLTGCGYLWWFLLLTRGR